MWGRDAAASEMTSMVRKQRKMNAHFFFFLQSRTPALLENAKEIGWECENGSRLLGTDLTGHLSWQRRSRWTSNVTSSYFLVSSIHSWLPPAHSLSARQCQNPWLLIFHCPGCSWLTLEGAGRNIDVAVSWDAELDT